MGGGPEGRIQATTEQLVRSRSLRLRAPLLPNGELLSKSQIFNKQLAAGTERLDNQNEKKLQQVKHKRILASRRLRFICLIQRQIDILARHKHTRCRDG